MTSINFSIADGIAHIIFNNGVTNPISTKFVNDFEQLLPQLESDSCKGVIIKGGEKFFSMGLNLPELLELERAEMEDFFTRFDDICYRIYSLNKPTMSVIEGHAVAGGAVLALMTDYRYAADSTKFFGLNEIKIGVPVPYLTSLVVHAIAPGLTAKELLYSGEFLPFPDASKSEIIDCTFPADELNLAAETKIKQLASFNQQTFSAMKNNQIEKVQTLYLKNKEFKNKEFLDCWFSQQSQELLKEAAKNF